MTTSKMREIRLWMKDLTKVASTLLLAKSVIQIEKHMNDPKIIRIEDARAIALQNNPQTQSNIVDEAVRIMNSDWNKSYTIKRQPMFLLRPTDVDRKKRFFES